MVSFAVRAEVDRFAASRKVTVPFPVPELADVTAAQIESNEAVHPQVLMVVSVTEPVPPAAAIATSVGTTR